MNGGGGGSFKLGELLGFRGWKQDNGDDEEIRRHDVETKLVVHDKKLMHSLLEAADEDHAKFLRRLRERIDR